MRAPEGDRSPEDRALVDRYIEMRFGVRPSDQAPAPPSGESGGTGTEPDEDAQFAAYMEQHFPAPREG